jgi:hypothetical protein
VKSPLKGVETSNIIKSHQIKTVDDNVTICYNVHMMLILWCSYNCYAMLQYLQYLQWWCDSNVIPIWFQYDSNLCNVFCTLLQYLRYLLLWWAVVSAWLGRLTGTKLRYPSFTWTPPEPLLIIWKMKKNDLIISTFWHFNQFNRFNRFNRFSDISLRFL